MVDYEKLRKKFPARNPDKRRRHAAIKAIAREYERKKAELGARAPDVRRGFPYYMTIIIGMILVAGLVCASIFERGGIDIAQRNRKKAEESIHNLAVALGRYRYHVGKFPDTDEGLEQLASKTVSAPGWNGPYVKRVNLDPWKNAYVYAYNGEGAVPTLYSCGPDGKPGTTDDLIADPADFDAAFRDTSWTKDWVPMHLRDIVVAFSEKQKKELQDEVNQILHPVVPVEGETMLAEGWTFSAANGGGQRRAHPVRVPHDWRATGTAEECASGTGEYAVAAAVPSAAAGKRVVLRFSRIAGRYDVAVDGKPAASGEGGAAPVEVDVSGLVGYGRRNEVRVRVTAPPVPADGYAGAGLVGEASIVVGDAAKSSPAAVREAPSRLKCAQIPATFGPLGAAFEREAARRVLRTMKEAGANAVAFASEPDAGYYGLCDEAGLYAVRPAGAAFDVVGVPAVGVAAPGALCDATGLPTPEFDAWRAFWNDGDLTIRILSHWNHDAKTAGTVKVRCATSCEEVELFVNGESAGRRRRPAEARSAADTVLEWDVPYDPGELKAIAYERGEYAGETVRRTAFAPCAVKLAAEKRSLAEGELVFVKVETVDEYGTAHPLATDEVGFALEGPGEIVAVANGSPDERGPFHRTSCRLREGRAVVVLRRASGGSGLPLKLTATADGLRPDYAVLPRR